MMIAAHVPQKLRYRLFKAAAVTATKLDGLCIVTIGDKEMTRYEAREESIPQWHK